MVINEIFNSVDGEVNKYGQGVFSTFIRTAGCNLRCKYCDTKYAQERLKNGISMETSEILKKITEIGCPKVTITGGEPLLQQAQFENLIYTLLQNEIYAVTVETNGTFSIANYPNRVSWVVDCKTPGSGHEDSFLEDNVKFLSPDDYIKFVICDEEDYKFAKEEMYRLIFLFRPPCKWAFSPVFPTMSPELLIENMQRDKLWDVQLNVQLHKYIGVR